jgi:hypothetical protein
VRHRGDVQGIGVRIRIRFSVRVKAPERRHWGRTTRCGAGLAPVAAFRAWS